MSAARLAAKVAGKRERIQSPQDFLAHHAAQNAAATTPRSYASVFASFRPRFAASYGQEPTPGAVTESVIHAWRDELARRGKAVATIRRRLSCLRSYLIAAGRPVPLVEDPREGARPAPSGRGRSPGWRRPSSEQARALADRWNALTERTMRGFQGDPKNGYRPDPHRGAHRQWVEPARARRSPRRRRGASIA